LLKSRQLGEEKEGPAMNLANHWCLSQVFGSHSHHQDVGGLWGEILSLGRREEINSERVIMEAGYGDSCL
jgi:hypothetical protein